MFVIIVTKYIAGMSMSLSDLLLSLLNEYVSSDSLARSLAPVFRQRRSSLSKFKRSHSRTVGLLKCYAYERKWLQYFETLECTSFLRPYDTKRERLVN